MGFLKKNPLTEAGYQDDTDALINMLASIGKSTPEEKVASMKAHEAAMASLPKSPEEQLAAPTPWKPPVNTDNALLDRAMASQAAPVRIGPPMAKQPEVFGPPAPPSKVDKVAKVMQALKGSNGDFVKMSAMNPAAPSPLVAKDELAKINDVYGADLNDAALANARKETKFNRFLASLAQASNTMGSAFTKGAGQEDRTYSDAFAANANSKEKDIVARREGKDKELKRKSEMYESLDLETRRDPNSDISKMLRAGIKNVFPNMNIPDNLSAEQLKDQGFNVGLLMSGKMNADARRDAARENALNRQNARDIALEDKKEQRAKLSDKQVSQIAEYEKPIKMLDGIIADKPKFDTGPIAGRWNSIASWIGLDEAKKSGFRSDVGDALAQYIKGISGAAVSESERRSLLANLPNMNDNDKTFMEKARRTQQRLRDLKDIDVDLMGKQGKNVSEFASGGDDQIITVVDPEGVQHQMPRKGFKAALKDGHKLKEVK